jgi:acetyl-CoA synthetase
MFASSASPSSSADASGEGRVEELLARFDGSDVCLAGMLCDDHPATDIAVTIVEADLTTQDVTYGELRERSERFAAALAQLGVGPGDPVGTLMGKSVDLVTAVLGIWRRGGVHVPLFTAFAAPAIEMRLRASGARAVVVDAEQRDKLDDAQLTCQIITCGGPAREGDLLFGDLLAAHEPGIAPERFDGNQPFIMIFTSGTTGAAKGVGIPVRTVGGLISYMEYGFDVRPEDVYWNAADPGWAYGLFYAIVAPLGMGRSTILLHAGSPELTWRVLSQLQVTNFAAAPTVYRVLRNTPGPVPTDLVVRCLSSAGEPLNPDVVSWAQETFGIPVHDHYGQTELGMVIVNGWNPAIRRPLKPGSMGHPLPGWTVEVLLDTADEVAPAGTLGRVAIDVHNSPAMTFTGYHEAPEKTAERISADGRWYYTGDAGSRDEDGYLFFSARDDDVIIMAGYRIGPFDIESVLVEHPDVAEAAVVGVPDELRGEVVEAFVVPRAGAAGSDDLATELQQHVKTRYAAHAYPRVVHFVDELPKTPSGKIQRFELRNRRRDQLT